MKLASGNYLSVFIVRTCGPNDKIDLFRLTMLINGMAVINQFSVEISKHY